MFSSWNQCHETTLLTFQVTLSSYKPCVKNFVFLAMSYKSHLQHHIQFRFHYAFIAHCLVDDLRLVTSTLPLWAKEVCEFCGILRFWNHLSCWQRHGETRECKGTGSPEKSLLYCSIAWRLTHLENQLVDLCSQCSCWSQGQVSSSSISLTESQQVNLVS